MSRWDCGRGSWTHLGLTWGSSLTMSRMTVFDNGRSGYDGLLSSDCTIVWNDGKIFFREIRTGHCERGSRKADHVASCALLVFRLTLLLLCSSRGGARGEFSRLFSRCCIARLKIIVFCIFCFIFLLHCHCRAPTDCSREKKFRERDSDTRGKGLLSRVRVITGSTYSIFVQCRYEPRHSALETRTI